MKKMALSVFVVVIFAAYAWVRQAAGLTSETPVRARIGAADNPIVPVQPTETPTPLPIPEVQAVQPTTPPPTPVPQGKYRDGAYTGGVFDAFYGNIQVQAVISGGKLAEVKILQYPNDRDTSIEINSIALPQLQQEAIQSQSAQVDIVSGATDSSSAFIQSLNSALTQAI